MEATRAYRQRRREAEEAEAFARRQAESERLRGYEAAWRARVAKLQAERSAAVSPDARTTSKSADLARSSAV